MPIKTDPALLQAALVGYQGELENITAAIDAIRALLNGKGTQASPITGSRKGRLSPDARKASQPHS